MIKTNKHTTLKVSVKTNHAAMKTTSLWQLMHLDTWCMYDEGTLFSCSWLMTTYILCPSYFYDIWAICVSWITYDHLRYHFKYLSRRGDLKNWKKGRWKYDAGAGYLKRGGGRLTVFPFNIFKVYYFYIYKFLQAFQNCVMQSKNKPENIP